MSVLASPILDKAAFSLGMAVVGASPGPLLLLDGDLVIIAASASFCKTFELDAADVCGKQIPRLGDGEWTNPRLGLLLRAMRSGSPEIRVTELDFYQSGQRRRRLVIQAERLAPLHPYAVRIMVAISDVTKVRDDHDAMIEAQEHSLIRLRAVQHRVSNSLQIVASVLLQDARMASSEEAKTRLAEAHQRVMSVASLEQLLASGTAGDVEMRTYLTNLCRTVSEAMVADPSRIDLMVEGPGGMVDPRTSLSIGLIATELVINAVKHAFPGGRHGAITVECVFPGPNWALVVSDNGVGVPTDSRDRRAGLGAGIVQSLAKELGAAVDVAPASPGTRVTVARTAIALVDSNQRLETYNRAAAANFSGS